MGNSLVTDGILKEMKCGSNISYILNDNYDFNATEYKVLLNQSENCFIKCMKTLYNGKTQLYYISEEYKPLSTFLNSLGSDGFIKVIENLFINIINIKNNGFLSCLSLDVDFSKIFVDVSTYQVKLIYLPIKTRGYEDLSSFENELKTELIKLISSTPAIVSEMTSQLSKDLADGSLTLESIVKRLKGNKTTVVLPKNEASISQDCGNNRRGLTFISKDPSLTSVTVTKTNFVIGKGAASDGIISYGPISRRHCVVNTDGINYTITDLQSSNGTYVNGKRLEANKATLITNGDVIKLANKEFRVEIA